MTMPLGHYKLKQTSDGQVVLLQEMGRLGLKQKDLVHLAGVSRSTLYFQYNPKRGVKKAGTTRADTAYRLAKALAQTELKREPSRKELNTWLNRCFESI
jgi:hypothetical protein